MNTEQRVSSIIKEITGTSLDDICLAKRLSDDLGADSVDILEIVMTVEGDFEIELDDDLFEGSEYASFTVGDLVKLIDSKVGD